VRRLALAAALLALTSCGGTASPGSSSGASASLSGSSTGPSTGTSATSSARGSGGLKALVVHIRNYAYFPPAPDVVVGQPIEIINDDVMAHTWSAAPKSGWTYTSGNLEKGQSVTFPGFTKPGSYKFLCYYHAEIPTMNGVATVKVQP
jgi:plastocyanin